MANAKGNLRSDLGRVRGLGSAKEGVQHWWVQRVTAIALIPLSLRGVKYRAVGAGALLSRNLLIYGLGGIVVPFIGIKAIDVAITALGLA